MCDKTKKQIVKAEILSNWEMRAEHFVMEVVSPYLGENSLPGQFVNIKTAENTFDPLLRIPLGIHAITKTGIKLLYKVVGTATRVLSLRAKGEEVNILGPLGNGFDQGPVLEEKEKKVFIVAGGHGIAPLYALCEEFAKQNIQVDFFSGVSTEEHLTCQKQLSRLGVRTRVASVDGSVGFKGNVTELLRTEISVMKKEKKTGIIFSCGPRPMLKEVAKIAREENVPAQVSLDAYMACGIGVCLGCAIKTVDGFKMVCKDGPVFRAQDIVWEEV